MDDSCQREWNKNACAHNIFSANCLEEKRAHGSLASFCVMVIKLNDRRRFLSPWLQNLLNDQLELSSFKFNLNEGVGFMKLQGALRKNQAKKV